MAQDPYKYFRVEAGELLEQLGRGILDLEKPERLPDLVPRLLRLAHTLKGAARVVRQGAVADQAHALEGAIAPFRDSQSAVPRERVDELLGLLDAAGRQVGTLVAPAGAAESARSQNAPDESIRTVRADVAEMDALLDGAAEAHAQVGALRTGLVDLERTRRLAELLVDQLQPRRGRDGDRSDSVRALSMAEELRRTCTRNERGLGTTAEQLDREVRQVREVGERLRLIPAESLFTSLERTARDTSQTLGKRVAFAATGDDVRLDAHVLREIQRALLQVVRNAVAHGVETESERKAAGKPAEARVTIEVRRRGRRVAFVCQDDGRGVDLEAVRRAAQRRGLPAERARNLGVDELLQLLLRGGISTSAAVTDVAGRGVGLDVVREVCARLGGQATIRTHAGAGTTIEIVVPLSLASLMALVVEAGGVSATIPLDAVRCILRVAPEELARTEQGESLVCDGKVVPFLSLSRALRGTGARQRDGRGLTAVILAGGGGEVAVGVDRLLGTAEIVLRPLPDLSPASPIVAGAFLDLEGNPKLVLDPDGLAAEARRALPAETEGATVKRPVLVVDDSLTTRMLEQSILESAGYEVHLATSGEEALEKARAKSYSLFLVDVEMPGMDGFSFLEHTRADPAMRDVPAILVTSRDSPEDRRRGEAAGARGHIVKSEFDQADLLERIRAIVG